MSALRTRRKATRELAPGDTLVFSGRGYRVTSIEPYDHASVKPGSEAVFADAFGVAHVEGHGAFMALFESSTVEVAA